MRRAPDRWHGRRAHPAGGLIPTGACIPGGDLVGPGGLVPAGASSRCGADGGSAVVDFVLVSILLIFLLFGVLQVAVYFYVRNVVTASAAEGARYAANADVNSTAGGGHTDELIGRAVGGGVERSVRCRSGEQVGAGGSTLVVVRCSGALRPVFAPLKRVFPMNVSARALKEGR